MINKAKCKNCGDVIESKSTHQMVSCSCYRTSSDAITARSDHFITSTKEMVFHDRSFNINEYDYRSMWSDPEYTELIKNARGFALDGGAEYSRIVGNFEDVIWIDDGLPEIVKQVQDTY